MGRRYFIPFEYGITVVYMLLGFLWILFSDNFIEGVSDDYEVVTNFQTYKGWAYVLITALLFFFFLKRHIGRLKRAEHRARESDRLKSVFLSNVSHEIRTPMNGILGFAELLQRNDLTAKEREEYTKIMEESSERLLLLINDLVAVSNLEAGTERIVVSGVNVGELLDNMEEAYAPVAAEKGVAFELDCDMDAGGLLIHTDKEKLTAILSRLIKNAVKYTDIGMVKVECEIDDDFLAIFVKDTGKGISEKVLERAFERFADIDKHLSGGNEGLGLGLSIAKSYARMMGGDIEARSVPGEGSVFSLRIPLKPDGSLSKNSRI
jgi:signal transduction histidine kinase